jgi:trimethylamine--corrinoid protein Co-methyltransferase
MIQRYFEPEVWSTSPDDLAVDAIAEVGSDGHFFGIQHTQDRYEHAFYQPFVSDWSNYEGWVNKGAIWTAERAHNLAFEILNEFEAPEMDVAIKDELNAFVDRRIAEGGAPTDF